MQELNTKGRTGYFSARGSKYILEIDTEYDGINLLDCYGDFITGYCDLQDFLSQQELIIIAFKNEQIQNVEEIKIIN